MDGSDVFWAIALLALLAVGFAAVRWYWWRERRKRKGDPR